MTHTSILDVAPTDQDTEVILIRQRSGIWSVSVNGQFHGDYTRRDWAIEAAVEKAKEIAAHGGAAVVMFDRQENVVHYDTRHSASARREKDWLQLLAQTFLRPFSAMRNEDPQPEAAGERRRPEFQTGGYRPLTLAEAGRPPA
jgi:hypothetical protein